MASTESPLVDREGQVTWCPIEVFEMSCQVHRPAHSLHDNPNTLVFSKGPLRFGTVVAAISSVSVRSKLYVFGAHSMILKVSPSMVCGRAPSLKPGIPVPGRPLEITERISSDVDPIRRGSSQNSGAANTNQRLVHLLFLNRRDMARTGSTVCQRRPVPES